MLALTAEEIAVPLTWKKKRRWCCRRESDFVADAALYKNTHLKPALHNARHPHEVANTIVLSLGPAAGWSGSRRCGLLSALFVQLHASSRYSEARGQCGSARLSLQLPRLLPLQLGGGGGGGFVSRARRGGGVEGGRGGAGGGAAGSCGGRLRQLTVWMRRRGGCSRRADVDEVGKRRVEGPRQRATGRT